MLRDLHLGDIVDRALSEDLGPGDITTECCLPAAAEGKAVLSAQGTGMLSGLGVQDPLFTLLANIYEEEVSVTIEEVKGDGKPVFKGEAILSIEGSMRVILSAERTLLNFLQHLSGIATETSRFVAAVRGTEAKIVDTRKTTPGLRMLEKAAVEHGGGHNHRYGLYDGVLIKDNHIAAAGGIKQAIAKVTERAPHSLRIEVECETLTQVNEAVAAGADIVLLDNMPIELMRKAVHKVGGKCLLEASGGITLSSVAEVAETGVDLISIGSITHSTKILPMHLEVEVGDS